MSATSAISCPIGSTSYPASGCEYSLTSMAVISVQKQSLKRRSRRMSLDFLMPSGSFSIAFPSSTPAMLVLHLN